MRPEPDDFPGCGVTEKDGESNCSARHAIPDMNPAEKGPSVKSRLNVTSSLSAYVQTQPSDKGQKTQVPINLSIHRISKQFV